MTRTVRKVTPCIPWKLFPKYITNATEGTRNIIGKEGGWASRNSDGILVNVHDFLGHQVKNILLCPYVESCKDGTAILYSIFGFRGRNNNAVYTINGAFTTGEYVVSLRCNGEPVITSGRYCDTVGITDARGVTYTTYDASGKNGRGFLQFDANGCDIITIEPTYVVPGTDGRLYFEISGF